MTAMKPPTTSPVTRRAVLALAASAAGAAPAQDEGVLRIVVPFAAGSTIDALARLIANRLPEVSAHKVVVVDNRPGAAGLLGTAYVAKAKPDGRTIVIQANGLTTTPAVRDDLPYDLQKDLAPLTLLGLAPYGLVVPPDVKHATLKDFFDAARASRQPITFGTSGPGSQSEFVLAQLAKAARVDFLKVPFKGQADILLGVMGGHVQMAMINMPSAVKQARDRKVRILATLTDRRTTATPDVPTLAEAGVPGIEESAWYGLLTTGGTPAPVVNALSRDLLTILAQPDVRARLEEWGIDIVASSPARFAERMAAELSKYKRLAREQNIRAE